MTARSLDEPALHGRHGLADGTVDRGRNGHAPELRVCGRDQRRRPVAETRKIVGLGLGVIGVALVAHGGTREFDASAPLGIAACLCAAACYGLSGVYIRKFVMGAKPMAIAGGSQIFAALILAPALFTAPPLEVVTATYRRRS